MFEKRKNEYPIEIEKNKSVVILLFILLLYSVRCFNLNSWNITYAGWCLYIIVLYFFTVKLFSYRKIMRQHLSFKSDIDKLMLLPLGTIIPCWLVQSQSPIDSLKALCPHFIWLIYYLLHIWKPSEKRLLYLLGVMAIIVFFIQIIQQFTYPIVVCGTFDENEMLRKGLLEDVEIRNGLYRFRLNTNGIFTMIILFYVWGRMKTKMMIKYFIVFIILLASIYLSLTRQLIVTSLVTLILFSFCGKGIKTKIASFLFLFFLSIVLWIYFEQLFGEFIETTSSSTNEDNIRILSAIYFGTNTIMNPLTLFLGNGFPKNDTIYGRFLDDLADYWGFFPEDVGFIGYMYFYGLLYVIAYFRLVYKVLLVYREYVPTYIKMFVVATGLISIMIYPLAGIMNYLVWSILLYICDLHIIKSSL